MTATAETKRIVCDQPVADNGLVELRDMMQKSCDRGMSSSCDSAKAVVRQIEECRTSGKQFSGRFVFTFDTSALAGNKNSFGEEEYVPCYNLDSRPIKKAEIESTPNNIIILMQSNIESVRKFVINRESLVGTYAGKSNWQCRLESVPQGKNKI